MKTNDKTQMKNVRKKCIPIIKSKLQILIFEVMNIRKYLRNHWIFIWAFFRPKNHKQNFERVKYDPMKILIKIYQTKYNIKARHKLNNWKLKQIVSQNVQLGFIRLSRYEIVNCIFIYTWGFLIELCRSVFLFLCFFFFEFGKPGLIEVY